MIYAVNAMLVVAALGMLYMTYAVAAGVCAILRKRHELFDEMSSEHDDLKGRIKKQKGECSDD
jgi:hypothetical protein